jgi:hypothetical protein
MVVDQTFLMIDLQLQFHILNGVEPILEMFGELEDGSHLGDVQL